MAQTLGYIYSTEPKQAYNGDTCTDMFIAAYSQEPKYANSLCAY
jgi:hypothetical protein